MTVAAEICAACGDIGIETRGFCRRCGSRAVVIDTIPGEGTVISLTEIFRPPVTHETKYTPYTVGLVALAIGPRLLARLPEGLAIGDTVSVTRETLDGATTLVLPTEIWRGT